MQVECDSWDYEKRCENWRKQYMWKQTTHFLVPVTKLVRGICTHVFSLWLRKLLWNISDIFTIKCFQHCRKPIMKHSRSNPTLHQIKFNLDIHYFSIFLYYFIISLWFKSIMFYYFTYFRLFTYYNVICILQPHVL